MTFLRFAKLASLAATGALLAGCVVLPFGPGAGRHGHHGHHALEPSKVRIDIDRRLPAPDDRRQR